MKVLVTGGAGYIGRAICDSFSKRGHSVYQMDDLSNSTSEGIEGTLYVESVENYQGVCNVVRSVKPDVVVNAAGLKDAVESYEIPAKYLSVNATGMANILSAANCFGVDKVIQSSSCAIYSPSSPMPLTEASPVDPSTPYGLSKLASEKLGRWWADRGNGHFVSLRYFNIAGAVLDRGIGERSVRRPTQLFPSIIHSLQTGKKFKAYTSPIESISRTPVRDYLHVEDVAEAHVLAAEKELSGIYNLGTGEGYSVTDVIECFERTSNAKVDTIFLPPRPGDVPLSIADATLAREQLGWVPKHNLESICDSAWQWHQQDKYKLDKEWQS
ncbi:NAD-dependent epimerase/dehydratase family protein [Corynebacterium striatum]